MPKEGLNVYFTITDGGSATKKYRRPEGRRGGIYSTKKLKA